MCNEFHIARCSSWTRCVQNLHLSVQKLNCSNNIAPDACRSETGQTSKPHWEINSFAHVRVHACVRVCERECSYKQLGGEISESPPYNWGKWNVGWEELRQGPLESRCSCFSARTYRVLLVLVRKARVSTACPGLHQRWPRAEASLS